MWRQKPKIIILNMINYCDTLSTDNCSNVFNGCNNSGFIHIHICTMSLCINCIYFLSLSPSLSFYIKCACFFSHIFYPHIVGHLKLHFISQSTCMYPITTHTHEPLRKMLCISFTQQCCGGMSRVEC